MIICVAGLALALAACGGNQVEEPAPEGQAQAAEADRMAEAAQGPPSAEATEGETGAEQAVTEAPAPEAAAETEAGPPYPTREEGAAGEQEPTAEEPVMEPGERMPAEPEPGMAEEPADLAPGEPTAMAEPEMRGAPAPGRGEAAPPAEEPVAFPEEEGDMAPPGPEAEPPTPAAALMEPERGASPRIAALERAYFGFDRDTLTPEAREVLQRNAEWLRRNAEVDVRVEGHCDERGTAEYNLALGQRRANRVTNYLIGQGIHPDRLFPVSYGEEVPVAPGNTEEAWSQNRRVEFSRREPSPGAQGSLANGR